MGCCEAVRDEGGGIMDRARWDRVHAAASRRWDRHCAAGYSARVAMQRYDRLMGFALLVLKGK